MLRNFFIVAAMLFSVSASAQGFQATHWGMSVAEVHQLYPSGSRECVLTKVVMGASCELQVELKLSGRLLPTMFLFSNGRLVAVSALGLADPEQTFDDVQTGLRHKYGEPMSVDAESTSWMVGNARTLIQVLRTSNSGVRATIIMYGDARFFSRMESSRSASLSEGL